MFVNGHAHIFNLQSVLSRETISIMLERLRGRGVHECVVEAVERLLTGLLRQPEYLSEDELLVRFVRAIAHSRHFGRLAAGVGVPVEVRLLSGAADHLECRALKAALDRLSSWIDAHDGPGKSPFDVFETLRVALQPTIPQVAERLLAHLGPDDALVALMMDIVPASEGALERRNFLGQIRGTMEAVLAHPGRVLPFIPVNPLRPDHHQIMQRAIEEQGFVGVKLYPSLGYQMTAPELGPVLGYCRDQEVPVLVHCTCQGFRKNVQTGEYADPRHWQGLFVGPEDPLRVCFAHFGGWGGFSGQDPDQRPWAETVLGYMDRYPHVYADISNHVEMMVQGGAVEEAYLEALQKLLAGPYGDRVILGTDSWLLRLNMDDAVFWRYFQGKCTPAAFAQLACTAPCRFLGIPVAGGPAAANIRRHIGYLERHADQVGAIPGQWVRQLSQAPWRVTRAGASWSPNNHAHVAAFNYFKPQIPPRLDKGFAAVETLRLRQLSYYSGSGTKPSARRLRETAQKLMSKCAACGGRPEGEHTEASILPLLVELLGDGGRTLADVGASLDACYLFAPEVA